MAANITAAGKVEALSVVVAGLGDKVERHDHWINGNGQADKGAKQIIENFDSRLDVVEEKIDKLQGSINKVAWFIGGPLILAVGGFFWALLTHQIELVMH